MPEMSRRDAALRLIRTVKAIDAARDLVAPGLIGSLVYAQLHAGPRLSRFFRANREIRDLLLGMAQALDPAALLDGDLASPIDPAWIDLLEKAEGMMDAIHGVQLEAAREDFERIMAATNALDAARCAVRNVPHSPVRVEVEDIEP